MFKFLTKKGATSPTPLFPPSICYCFLSAFLLLLFLVRLSEEAHDELEDALEALFDPEDAVEIVSAALLGRA